MSWQGGWQRLLTARPCKGVSACLAPCRDGPQPGTVVQVCQPSVPSGLAVSLARLWGLTGRGGSRSVASCLPLMILLCQPSEANVLLPPTQPIDAI